MSNWQGTARSNYVRIKDMTALLLALEGWDIRTESDLEGRVAFFSLDGDTGGWPCRYNEETEDYDSFDAVEQICPHMAEGEILVMMEAGAEKWRYITGQAIAYNHQGEYVSVELSDIYARARVRFGGNPTKARY